jgi:hypothetical protein
LIENFYVDMASTDLKKENWIEELPQYYWNKRNPIYALFAHPYEGEAAGVVGKEVKIASSAICCPPPHISHFSSMTA